MKKKIESYIKKQISQGYVNGIPDEADSRLEALNKVPSYRRICMAIFKNDLNLTSLGYQKPNCEIYNEIKRAEIAARRKP